MLFSATISLPFLAGLAVAKTINIKVGETGNIFEPSSITADVGDLLSFTFYPEKHAVVSSNFDRPCKNQLGNAGFSSDFVPVAAGKSSKAYVFKVTSTDPLFFYCPQSRHCQSGMVGVVNPSDSQTLDQYKQAAAKVPLAQAPPPIYGLTPVGGDDSPTTTSTKRHTSTTSSDDLTTTQASVTTSTSGDSSTTISVPGQTVPTTRSSSTAPTTSSTSSPNSGAMDMRAGRKSTAFVATIVAIFSAFLMAAGGVFRLY